MKILLVEDNVNFGENLKLNLEAQQHKVEWLQDGKSAHIIAKEHFFDVMILDLELPNQHGFSILEKIRNSGLSIPILIFTALEGTEHCVRGLEHGADDYMVKPTDFSEIHARLKVILRRSQGRFSKKMVYKDIEIDDNNDRVSFKGQYVNLTHYDLTLLKLFISNTGLVMSKEQIIDKLYKYGVYVESNVIAVHIHNLRKIFGKSYIKTIYGLGYTMEAIPDSIS